MKNKKKKVAIIGAGTAGLVIANNLQDFFDVTVIEKSQYKKYPKRYNPPLLIGILFRKTVLKYMSKRYFQLKSGRQIPFFESNVFGGASTINGCVHMLGDKSRWSSILEKFNSNYEELIGSYKKIYSLNPKEKNKINLSISFQNVIDKSFLKTLNYLGIKNGDTNYSNVESCGPIYNTVKRFFRTSVVSIIREKKFKLLLGESVENLLFDGINITGLRTNKRNIRADYIVLSGGVIGTCELLINEKSRLKDMGSKIFKDCNFGENIQDHSNLRVNVLTNTNIGSLNEISNSFIQKIYLLIKHYSGMPTLMKGTGATSAVHLDLNGDGEIDTRIQVVQFSETGRHGSSGKFFSSDKPGFSLSITPINPESRGKIVLNESNDIVVDPMLLSSQKDIDILKLALRFCLKLLKSSPVSKHVLKIEDEIEIEADSEKYIKSNIFSGHHLIGGTYDSVNSNFELKGVKGMYICDASVFDEYAASNIHSSVVLIADIFSKKFITRNFLQ